MCGRRSGLQARGRGLFELGLLRFQLLHLRLQLLNPRVQSFSRLGILQKGRTVRSSRRLLEKVGPPSAEAKVPQKALEDRAPESVPSEEGKEKEETVRLRKNKDGDDSDLDDLKEDTGEEIESNCEFMPIEHPMEPLEEDMPAECPNSMPDSSFQSSKRIIPKKHWKLGIALEDKKKLGIALAGKLK
ncbi:hypothetical protein KSP39_PZI005897 [Platanthera zijinensis]|uniref:Uncharacterized protein n=1 Tax=Platanthera zijinensis TaxID=2320716 RepID=A0AAP0BSF1_9ASPA